MASVSIFSFEKYEVQMGKHSDIFFQPFLSKKTKNEKND